MVFFDFMLATAAFTSFGTTSPLYIMQQAIYFPFLGLQPTIMFPGSKAVEVSSYVVKVSWNAFSEEINGEYEQTGKWTLGYGTRLVWNSVRSQFSDPSNLSDAVIEEMHCAMSLFKLVNFGLSTSMFLIAISYIA
jgi:hypothetical protein